MHLSAENQAKFAAQFSDPNIDIKDLEHIWGKASGTLYRWGFELGVKRPKRKGETQVMLEQVRQFCERVSRELIPYDLPARISIHDGGAGRAMELILWLCDLHAGRLTRSFNAEVFGNRMYALALRLEERVRALRNFYSINKLSIFALGDYVVGENVGRNITLDELEHAVLPQVYNICVPQLVLFTDRIAGSFEQVDVHCVRGNHGALNKFGPSKSANWDTVAYLAWEAKMSGQASKNVNFDIETINWFKYARVRQLEWLLVHGDQFPASGGSPYAGMRSKVDRWHNSMPKPFDKVACGHFHHFANVAELWMGATLLSDDDWSREVLGREGDCGQLVVGVTDQGIEHVMPIGLRDIGEYE